MFNKTKSGLSFHNAPFIPGLLLLCLVLLSNLAIAAPTYSVTENHAEITLKIDGETDYKIDYQDSRLQISFNKPFAQELNNIDSKLKSFVDHKNISADGRNMTLELSSPVNVRNRVNNNILTINLEKLAEEQNTSKPDNLNNDLHLSYGMHDAFARFVFEYNQKPQYSIQNEENKTIISFLSPVNIISVNLKDYPQSGKITKQKNKAGGLDIVLPERLLESSEFKNKLVFDMEKNPEAAPVLRLFQKAHTKFPTRHL